jgi:hypothetical protein
MLSRNGDKVKRLFYFFGTETPPRRGLAGPDRPAPGAAQPGPAPAPAAVQDRNAATLPGIRPARGPRRFSTECTKLLNIVHTKTKHEKVLFLYKKTLFSVDNNTKACYIILRNTKAC